MVGCPSSIYTCWTRALWCIRLLCLRAGCNRLLMRPPKGPTTPRARPRVELVKLDDKDDDDKDDQTENVIQNIVHSANHNTPATTIVAQGKFQWNEWIPTDTLGNNRGIKVSIYTHKNYKTRKTHKNHKSRKCVIKRQRMTTNVQREVDCLRQCNHPNIVQYIDHRVRNGRMELAMAYCPNSEGKDLCDYILSKRDAHTVIDLGMARQIAYQLLTAVAYLHETLGIVHRDIKPDNISFDEQTRSIKLLDFGCARPFTEDTRLTSIVGTLLYMPPEMLLKLSYTCTVDEWSTGVTLFTVFYGCPPFSGKTDICNKKPWPVECKRSSEAYDCIHNQLLCKDPTTRATAAQVLQSAWLRPCRDTAQT